MPSLEESGGIAMRSFPFLYACLQIAFGFFFSRDSIKLVNVSLTVQMAFFNYMLLFFHFHNLQVLLCSNYDIIFVVSLWDCAVLLETTVYFDPLLFKYPWWNETLSEFQNVAFKWKPYFRRSFVFCFCFKHSIIRILSAVSFIYVSFLKVLRLPGYISNCFHMLYIHVANHSTVIANAWHN